MSLDVDGILRVTAIEKRTGKSKQITIQDSLRPKSEEEIAAARKRLEELFSTARVGGMEVFEESETSWEGMEEEFDPEEWGAPEALEGPEESNEDSSWTASVWESYWLVERSRSLLGKMHDEDKEEAIDLNAEVETAIAREDREALEKARARRSLEELLFFVRHGDDYGASLLVVDGFCHQLLEGLIGETGQVREEFSVCGGKSASRKIWLRERDLVIHRLAHLKVHP